jgi:CubicO group peptidase (beta-lactamase class C family)
MRKQLLYFVLVLITAISCHDDPVGETSVKENPTTLPPISEAAYYFPPRTGNDWATISIDSLPWNADSLQMVLDFVKDKKTHGFMILYKGRIVTENYWNDWTAETQSSIASAGKSITAFLYGIAQQEGLLDINQPTSDFLGKGWSSMTEAHENEVKVVNHLTMTTGLADSEDNCIAPNCLHFKTEAGKRWSYNNVSYFLLHPILEKASGIPMNEYTKTRLADKIGLHNWSWENYQIALNTRDMARFGLLILAKGTWDKEKILTDSVYYNAMINTSNQLNLSYGYLWWLNGKKSYMVPEEGNVHQGSLTPAAPADMISAMGRGDKKIYIVPSLDVVVVRHGEDTGEGTFGPSSFDNELWKRLNSVFRRSNTVM